MSVVYWFVSACTIVEVLMIVQVLMFSSDEKLIKRAKKYFASTVFMYVVFYISLWLIYR